MIVLDSGRIAETELLDSDRRVLGSLSLIAQRRVVPTAEAVHRLRPERACRIGPTSEPRDQRRE